MRQPTILYSRSDPKFVGCKVGSMCSLLPVHRTWVMWTLLKASQTKSQDTIFLSTLCHCQVTVDLRFTSLVEADYLTVHVQSLNLSIWLPSQIVKFQRPQPLRQEKISSRARPWAVVHLFSEPCTMGENIIFMQISAKNKASCNIVHSTMSKKNKRLFAVYSQARQ